MASEVFIELDSSSATESLTPASLVSMSDRRIVVCGMELETIPEPQAVIMVHWMDGGVMLKRPTEVVQATRDADASVTLELEPSGETVPASVREAFRVQIGDIGIRCAMNGKAVRILDVSASGLSFASRDELGVGDVPTVRVIWQDLVCEGPARVQSAQFTPEGERRYGLQALGKDGGLLQGLRTLSSEIQRRTLAGRPNSF